MTDFLTWFFNHGLDVTAVLSCAVKTFSIYIVIYHTPPKLRHFSMFILNEMGWNFAGNMLYTFGHPIPMMPAECFRFDGLLSEYFPDQSDTLGHLFFLLIMLTVLNFALGLAISFQFRYMVISCKSWIRKFHPAWGYFYCALVHLINSAFFVYNFHQWGLSLEEYPNQSQITNSTRLFCYKPDGFSKSLALGWLFVTILIIVALLIIFTALCQRQLRINEASIEATTIRLQRKLLKNLLILTAVPVIIAGAPLLTAIFFVYMNELPYARSICAVCIMFCLNHGTIYAITTLIVFKAYRRAVHAIVIHMLKMVLKVVKRTEETSTVYPTLVRSFHP